MRSFLITSILLLAFQFANAQNMQTTIQNSQKGKFYIYWGWNRGWYSKSDIAFTGSDYDFELKKVFAKDKQTPFGFDPYFHPGKISIPQYNFRIGYFIKENWDISFGMDHMKYVVQGDQSVEISGAIEDPESDYYGYYTDDLIVLSTDFLLFEHTDGLNYVNIELRRFDKIAGLNKISLNLTEGVGMGLLVPRTNTTLLSKDRYDEFHLAGFGFSSMIGVNVTFFDVIFLQTEFKGGYISMPDIRTTSSVSDQASQSFFFAQWNVVFGVAIKIPRNP